MSADNDESPAMKAALRHLERLETVMRPGPDGVETVRIVDLTAIERALLLAMLVRRYKERLN